MVGFGYFCMNGIANGILEQQPTNNRSIEIQLMRRFVRDNNAYTMQLPHLYREELQGLTLLRPNLTGSLLVGSSTPDDGSEMFVLPTLCTRHVFMACEIQILTQLMKKMKILTSEDAPLNSAYYNLLRMVQSFSQQQLSLRQLQWLHGMKTSLVVLRQYCHVYL